jgi:hypothetical protein
MKNQTNIDKNTQKLWQVKRLKKHQKMMKNIFY